MPTNLVKTAEDEKLWSKAKAIVESEYKLKESDGDRYWRLVVGIYKKMGGNSDSVKEMVDYKYIGGLEMPKSNNILIEGIIRRNEFMAHLNETTEMDIGTCDCCGEKKDVRNIEETNLCMDCLCVVRRAIEEGETEKFVFHGSINPDKAKKLYEEYKDNINEHYVIFDDMDKLKKDAASANKSIEVYLGDKYNVRVDNVKPDKIDFRNGDIDVAKAKANNKFNQMLIDYKGRFAKPDIASKLKPDADGTMAYPNGGTTVPTPSATTKPSTPVAQPAPTKPVIPANASAASQPNPTVNAGSLPADLTYALGKNDTITVKYTGGDSQGDVVSISSTAGGHMAARTPKNASRDAIARFIVGNLDKSTGGKVKNVITVTVYGITVECAMIQGNYENTLKDLSYIVNDKYNLINFKPFQIDFVDVVTVSGGSETIDALEKAFDAEDITLKDSKFKLCGADLDVEFNGFAKDAASFMCTYKGKKFPIAVILKDVKKDYDEAICRGIGFSIGIPFAGVKLNRTFTYKTSTQYTCEMQYKEIKNGKLIYTLKNGNNANVVITAEIKDISTIEKDFGDAIDDYLKTLKDAVPVGPKSAKKLNNTGSVEKAGISGLIGDYVSKNSSMNYDVTTLVDADVAGTVLKGMTFTITGNDEVPANQKADDYLEKFANEVKNNGIWKKDGCEIKDKGLDDDGMPYVVVYVKDKKFLEDMINKFSLTESKGWIVEKDKVELKANKIMEGIKRR